MGAPRTQAQTYAGVALNMCTTHTHLLARDRDVVERGHSQLFAELSAVGADLLHHTVDVVLDRKHLGEPLPVREQPGPVSSPASSEEMGVRVSWECARKNKHTAGFGCTDDRV